MRTTASTAAITAAIAAIIAAVPVLARADKPGDHPAIIAQRLHAQKGLRLRFEVLSAPGLALPARRAAAREGRTPRCARLEARAAAEQDAGPAGVVRTGLPALK